MITVIAQVGQITVSSPPFAHISESVHTAAASIATARQRGTLTPPLTRSTAITEAKAHTNSANEPSALFLPSAIFHFILCFPKRLPMSAARASPTPHA